MQLNAFIWQNFLESAKGQNWVEFFAGLRGHYETRNEQLKSFIEKWGSEGFFLETDGVDAEIDRVLDAMRVLEEVQELDILPSTAIHTWNDADKYYQIVADLTLQREDDGDAEDVFYCHDVPRLSVALYCLYPKVFFPYYFYPQFHVLKRICDDFGIFLPPVPPKKDGLARFLYYGELCRSLHDFWTKLGLVPEHIPAFLYGFAPEVIDLRCPSIEQLPKARRAWFVGGGINNNGDFEYLDCASSVSQAIWQGNAETETGDIIVMYCLTPRSYIHSIWRAIRPGAIEPFRNFYSTIWIGYPQRVTPVSYVELKADPVMSEMPLVKGNMQGLNGRQIHKRFYDRALDLLQGKGTDMEFLPRLEDAGVVEIGLRTERDVEIHLLEPLLVELGFMAGDWERQVKLRVGRGEKAIPDYVLLPSRDASSRSVRGAWIWEAKFSITSHKELQRDFAQATSYARLLGARGAGLISREGAWISLKEDDYSLQKARHWPSQQLGQNDHINELRCLAGKRKLSMGR